MSIINMAIQQILFCDFDGVLCYDKFWRSLSTEEYEKVQEFLFKENSHLIGEWMRGKYSSEEINIIVSENTNIPFKKLWSTFIQDCKTMTVPKKALETLNALRKNYIVILITSNMDCFDRFTVPALGLQKHFDHISNSFSEGMLKTDDGGQLYTKLSNKFNIPIEQCLVFDDSKTVHKTFSELGGSAHLVTTDNDILFHLSKLVDQGALAQHF